PCICGAPAGVTCQPPVLELFADGACKSACGSPVPLTASGCETPPACTAFTISASVPTSVACAPDGGAPSLPATSWSRAAGACAPASPLGQGSCAASEVCTPSPAPPYAPRFCVAQPGAASACPAAPYTDGPHIFYGGTKDDRACSACACAASS